MIFFSHLKYTTNFLYDEDKTQKLVAQNFFLFPKEQNSTIIFLWLIQTKPFTFWILTD